MILHPLARLHYRNCYFERLNLLGRTGPPLQVKGVLVARAVVSLVLSVREVIVVQLVVAAQINGLQVLETVKVLIKVLAQQQRVLEQWALDHRHRVK